MDKIIVQLIFTQEEVDALMEVLELTRNNPNAIHLKERIYKQQYPDT